MQREAFRAWNGCLSIKIGGDTAVLVQDTVFQLSKDIKADVLCCKYESVYIRAYSSCLYSNASLDARMAIIGLKLM
jgi:hypothetical protein